MWQGELSTRLVCVVLFIGLPWSSYNKILAHAIRTEEGRLVDFLEIDCLGPLNAPEFPSPVFSPGGLSV